MTQDQEPTWSVMIPTCNDALLLRRAVTSVLEQDPGREAMQIEVVDDCSDEVDVAALVRELAGDRVAVWSHPARVGAIANFNSCIERSAGRWVHILHADDYVLPGFYDAYRRHLESHPAGIAVSRSRFVDADERDLGLSGELPMLDGYLVDAELLLARDNPVNFASVVVARSAYESVGPFDQDLPHAADWEMWTRLAHAGPVAVVDGVFACYRRHEGSDTSRLQRSMVYLTDPVAAIRIIADRIDDPVERRAVRRHVHRRLSAHALEIGGRQADEHRHRLAATSALWAARLDARPEVIRAAGRLVGRSIRNRAGWT